MPPMAMPRTKQRCIDKKRPIAGVGIRIEAAMSMFSVYGTGPHFSQLCNVDFRSSTGIDALNGRTP
jgi:hypothetical protein